MKRGFRSGYTIGFLSAGLISLALLIGWRYWILTPSYHIRLHTWTSATVYWDSNVLADFRSPEDLRRLKDAIAWYHADEGDGMQSRCGEGDKFFVRIEDSRGRSVDLELPVDDCLHVNVLHREYGFYATEFLQALGTLTTDATVQQKPWLSSAERHQLIVLLRVWRKGQP